MDGDLGEKRLRELALRASRTGEPAHTRFLEPPLEVAARAAANAAGCQVDFFGGYPGAERRVAAFYTDEPGNWPIERLRLSWNPRYGSPGHRDILGAIMALGIVRASLGDIAVLSDHALAFVHRDVADYVLLNLESAGRVRLEIERDAGDFEAPEPGGAISYRTVASERLDALVASALHLSREAAQKLIASELVKVNHEVNPRPDAKLSAGDIVSARGYGRFKLAEITGETRKGRLGVRIFMFGK
ncbi:MAG: hypothetical protein GX647_02990 [Clostridiales bacterium]|jgi:RNA-binding protein YlmH|nr:hypothetical protein [Clostridiales bacterium]OPZ69377.1 MAG: hypothetical protein BWY81_00459 [Firmicutes bacterium ADurb.Bin467]